MTSASADHTPKRWLNNLVLKFIRDQLAASGLDPSVAPDEPPAFWTEKIVCQRAGLSKASIDRYRKAKLFPEPVKLYGPKSAETLKNLAAERRARNQDQSSESTA